MRIMFVDDDTHEAGRAAAPPSKAAILCSKTADVGYIKSIILSLVDGSYLKESLHSRKA